MYLGRVQFAFSGLSDGEAAGCWCFLASPSFWPLVMGEAW